jgi:hypothetical protein
MSPEYEMRFQSHSAGPVFLVVSGTAAFGKEIEWTAVASCWNAPIPARFAWLKDNRIR